MQDVTYREEVKELKKVKELKRTNRSAVREEKD